MADFPAHLKQRKLVHWEVAYVASSLLQGERRSGLDSDLKAKGIRPLPPPPESCASIPQPAATR